MPDLNFRDMLDLLSKSSPEAVSTLHSKQSPARKFKEYLYVRPPIEQDLCKLLDDSSDPKRIIFLCGSSGDGKSEVLSRVFNKYNGAFNFHLDATHSFSPTKDAIETLDEQFRQHKESRRPLVVGINMGMLGNYSVAGSDSHSDITDSISVFLRKDESSLHHIFLNFEDYPKFELDGDDVTSPFILKLLDKITNKSKKNPLYQAFLSEDPDSLVHANYRLLQMPEVRDRLVQVLLQVRLKFDQFLTARTILDFIHQILTGSGPIFDNLFTGQGSDLALALRHFDPCTVRSRRIDLFLIQRSVGIIDQEFDRFRGILPPWITTNDMAAGSWIRLFYLLQDVDIGNNFHQQFAEDFRNELFEQYLKVWILHRHYTGDQEQKPQLRNFYNQQLIEALLRFANRFAPELTKNGELLLNVHNNYTLSVRANLGVSLKRIMDHKPKRLGHFSACIRLGDLDLAPIEITVNYFELILRIIRGYRPNKHDKNNIVMFEEMIEEAIRQARRTTSLQLHWGQEQRTLINETEENEIRVEG